MPGPRFRVASVAGAVSAVVLLAACGGGENETSSSDLGATVRIGGTQAYVPTLPAFYGAEAGIFEEHGVEAEVMNFEGGGASMEALAAGEVDLINYLPAGLAQAVQGEVEAKVVAAGSEVPQGWWLTALTDSGYETVADLDGADIGVSAAGATTDLYAQYVIDQAGVSANFVPVGGSGMIPALTEGNVDAILAFPPQGYELENQHEIVILADLAEEPALRHPDVWIASKELIEERPEVLEDTLAAFYESVQVLQGDRQLAVDQIVELAGYPDETAERAYEDTIMALSTNGEFTMDSIATAMDLSAESDALPPVEDIATTDFVPIAQ